MATIARLQHLCIELLWTVTPRSEHFDKWHVSERNRLEFHQLVLDAGPTTKCLLELCDGGESLPSWSRETIQSGNGQGCRERRRDHDHWHTSLLPQPVTRFYTTLRTERTWTLVITSDDLPWRDDNWGPWIFRQERQYHFTRLRPTELRSLKRLDETLTKF